LRWKTVEVLGDEDALVPVDVAVRDAVDSKVLAEEAARLVDDARWIGERPDRIVQAPEKRLPAVSADSRIFRMRSLDSRPRLLGGRLDERDVITCPAAR
jgi:hypothetical protein